MSDWTRNTLESWRKIKLLFGLPKAISALSNVGFLREFIPSHIDAGFEKWAEHGLLK